MATPILVTAVAASHDWWDIASTFGAAIIGAAAAALPAYHLARKASREVLRRDETARREEAKLAARSIAIKLTMIIDGIATLRTFVVRHLEDSQAELRKGRELWMLLPPMVGFSSQDAVQFDPYELSLIFGEGEYETLRQLILLQRRATSLEMSFRAYCERREALAERLPTPVAWEGDRGVSPRPSREEEAKLKVYTVPLDSLVATLSERLDFDWNLAKSVVKRFEPVGRRFLEMPGFTILFDHENQPAGDPV